MLENWIFLNIPTDSLVSSTQKILGKKYFNEFPYIFTNNITSATAAKVITVDEIEGCMPLGKTIHGSQWNKAAGSQEAYFFFSFG